MRLDMCRTPHIHTRGYACRAHAHHISPVTPLFSPSTIGDRDTSLTEMTMGSERLPPGLHFHRKITARRILRIRTAKMPGTGGGNMWRNQKTKEYTSNILREKPQRKNVAWPANIIESLLVGVRGPVVQRSNTSLDPFVIRRL